VHVFCHALLCGVLTGYYCSTTVLHDLSTALCMFSLLCSTLGYRSGLYAQELQQQGIQAANLIGGICAWVR
jgi:hypothetical protein